MEYSVCDDCRKKKYCNYVCRAKKNENKDKANGFGWRVREIVKEHLDNTSSQDYKGE